MSYSVKFCTAPKPPLCKGRWHGEAVTEGLCGKGLRIRIKLRRKGKIYRNNPSVSCADSSLCTREPWALPRQRMECKKSARLGGLFML